MTFFYLFYFWFRWQFFPSFVCNQKIKEFNNIIFVLQILCQKKLILYIESSNYMCVYNICLYTLVFEFPVSIIKNLKFLTSWWLHEPRNSQKYKTTHVRTQHFFLCSLCIFFHKCVFVRKKGDGPFDSLRCQCTCTFLLELRFVKFVRKSLFLMSYKIR